LLVYLHIEDNDRFSDDLFLLLDLNWLRLLLWLGWSSVGSIISEGIELLFILVLLLALFFPLLLALFFALFLALLFALLLALFLV